MISAAPPQPVHRFPEKPAASIYNKTFWLCYIANAALVTANAMTFRFADFVHFLSGTDVITGTIMGVGLTVAIIARLPLGIYIDQLGTRRIWIASSLLFLCGCIGFVSVTQLNWLIYVSRMAFALGIAGMFTSAIVFIQNQVPVERRTEVIGNLGSSGFVGMVVGSLIADGILYIIPESRLTYIVLFGTVSVVGACYLGVVIYLTSGTFHERPLEKPPVFRLIIHYWPGVVLLVAMMMGIGMAVTGGFLASYIKAKGFIGIGPFFFGYAISAFTFRMLTRHWSKTVGRHRMILFGLAGHAIGHATLPFLTESWQLLLPAIACGFGHALLFPAVVSLGSGTFPQQYRGLGTTLTLGCCELGCAIFAPVLGTIIVYVSFQTMFFTSSIMAVVVAIIYQLTAAKQQDEEQTDKKRPTPVTVSTKTETGKHLPDQETDEEIEAAIVESVSIPFPHIGRGP